MTGHQEPLAALRASVAHLRDLVEDLGESQLTGPAYPTEWTVADTLSHLGSGATIMARRFQDVLAGQDTPDDFNQSVWDEWNAKSPAAQATDLLAADQAFVDAVGAVTDEQAEAFTFPFGPMTLDLGGALSMRLAEHALHTWDVEVVLDPEATVLAEAVPTLLGPVATIVRFAAKPAGATGDVHVRTTAPDRRLVVALAGDSASLTDGTDDDPVDLALPAEAFIRLVYGRLDPDHAPAVDQAEALDQLRSAFPGF